MTHKFDAVELSAVASLTVELTRLRQNECKHLCVENIAPEIFENLLRGLATARSAPPSGWRLIERGYE